MKIEDCIKQLESAELALEAAPQKGFVDLDKIKKSLCEARDFLKGISARLRLGDKLIDDIRASMTARLRVLQEAGGGILASQAQEFLRAENLEYEKLMALQREIDQSLKRIFGGYSKGTGKQNKPEIMSSPKVDDYQ